MDLLSILLAFLGVVIAGIGSYYTFKSYSHYTRRRDARRNSNDEDFKDSSTDSSLLDSELFEGEYVIRSNIPLELRRRRYLSYAMQGIPHQDVINCVANHLIIPDPEIAFLFDLDKELSTAFKLKSHSILFRNNTTQCFRDALEAILLHQMEHHSLRGEEGITASRILGSARRSMNSYAGHFVFSDVDHPAISYMAKQIWPSYLIPKPVALADIVLGNENNDYNGRILSRYMAAIDNGEVGAVVIPHVVWINGAVLDVASICRTIKKQNPFIITIVDGAQAVGHLDMTIENVERENEDIDFYLGCGHKWLCGPETIGFCRVGKRFREDCPQCHQFLAASDIASDIIGLSSGYKGLQIGTNQRGIAKGLACAIQVLKKREGGIAQVYKDIHSNADILREIIKSSRYVNLIGPASCAATGIVGFVTLNDQQQRISKLAMRLGESLLTPTVYALPSLSRSEYSNKTLFRLSPGPDFTSEDADELASTIMEIE